MQQGQPMGQPKGLPHGLPLLHPPAGIRLGCPAPLDISLPVPS